MNYQSLMTRSEAVVDVSLITMQGDGGHNLRQSGSIQQGHHHHHHHFMVVISISKVLAVMCSIINPYKNPYLHLMLCLLL
jgi:hypothetical protein